MGGQGVNMIPGSLTCLIDLPEFFRATDILAFHKRDTQEIAEQVTEKILRKGMVWAGHPACLTIRFYDRQAEVELAIDGGVAVGDTQVLTATVRRMLGLSQDIEGFERVYRTHPQLRRLIVRQPGLRVPVAATPFEALTWAVTGQQISVSAAVSLRRKLISAANVRHSCGLLCHPAAGRLAELGEDTVRQAGFSTTKARTLLALSQLVTENKLPLDEWTKTVPVEEIRERLLAVPGIGPWTVNYTLLRGFGWLDGSLHGDAAVRRGLQALLGVSEKISEEQAQEWLAGFSPWRALIAAHLWAAQSSVAY